MSSAIGILLVKKTQPAAVLPHGIVSQCLTAHKMELRLKLDLKWSRWSCQTLLGLAESGLQNC